MKPLALLMVALLMLAGCEKNDREAGIDLPNGLYVGTFVRTGMDTADITLNLVNGTYQGSSSIDKYPAICAGSFTTEASNIQFQDTCTWTADFDWSLILNGPYNVNFNENILRIWKTDNNRTDEYLLRRMVR